MSGLGAQANDVMSARCEPNLTGRNTVEKQLGENKMKTTPWNEWDHIKTIEDARTYVETIYEEWFEESDAANDCIVEILESYMEFISIMESTLNCYAELPDKIENMSKALIAKRRNEWKPILDKAKEMQKARKSAKKTA